MALGATMLKAALTQARFAGLSALDGIDKPGLAWPEWWNW
jgi:hypothetical protein